MKAGKAAIEALAALAVFEELKPIHFTDDDLHLIRWLVLGHPNEKDEQVQRLFDKVGKIQAQRKREREEKRAAQRRG